MDQKRKIKSWHVWLVLLALIVIRVVLMFGLDKHTYWTFDEPWNTDTAKQVLNEKQFRRTKDSFTPISILNVYVGEKLLQEFPQLNRLTSYRVAGIVVNQAAVPLTYVFALQLGATVAMALFFTAFLSLDPNLMGHTILASNVDGYIFTWFMLLAVCAFYWAKNKSWKRNALFGLVLGLAQGVKLTSAYAVPLCLAWIIYVLWRSPKREKVLQLLCFLFFSWLGLNLFYAFNKIGTPFGHVLFISPQFIKLRHLIRGLPIPIPVDYVQGLDMCLSTDAIPRPVYIMDHYFMHGVWYYFLYALLVKTPLPLLISASVGWFCTVKRKSLSIQQKFLILFSAFFMFYFSVMLNAQVGVRYLFPIYGFILAGFLWFPWTKKTAVLASVWMIFTLWYNWPNDIGYFNELVPVKHHRWWHLGDSNLTWNQEWNDWPGFVAANRLTGEQQGPATIPLNIPFFEDAITVAGILRDPQHLELLRENFKPYDSFFGGVKLKYLITPQEVAARFPPLTGPLPQTSGAVTTVGSPCREGFSSNVGGQQLNNLNLIPFNHVAPGAYEFAAGFTLTQDTDVFFEMSSVGRSMATLNGFPILNVEEPTPRLVGNSFKLLPGVYKLDLKYVRAYGDGYFSFRAYDLSSDSAGRPIKFCTP